MKVGFIILLVFAALWGVAALISLDAPRATLLLPLALSFMFAVGGRTAFQGLKSPPEEMRRIRSLVRFYSAFEMLLIIAAVFLLGGAHLPQFIAPAICVIVGAHFIPLARGIPLQTYYATGAALITAGLVGTALPQRMGSLFVSSSAALMLWATALAVWVQVSRVRVRFNA
jgi:hypothetical protein